MRIAYVCTDFGVPILGHQGTAVHIRELSRALQRLGHEVVIVAPRINGPTPDDFDVEVFEFGLEGPERRVYELLNEDPSAGAAAASEIRALLYAATLRYRLHGILNVFRPDAIYERYSPLGSAGQAIARGLGIPLILEVGAPSPGEPAVHRGQAFGQTARALERAVLREADLVVAVSRTLIAWLEQIGVAPERIAAMPTAAEVERFAAGAAARDAIRADLGLGPADPVVGFVGDLAPWHGAAMVVRAVAALRRRRLAPRLLVVGDGAERAAIEALARSAGIAEATLFVGAVPDERLPELLAAMDVVTASGDRTDRVRLAPLTVVEAMAAGRPIVAAAGGRIGDNLRHGKTGLLYPPGDAGALADAIAALLVDRVRAAALGRAAQADVRAGRLWDATAQAVTELIDQVRHPQPVIPPTGHAGLDAMAWAGQR